MGGRARRVVSEPLGGFCLFEELEDRNISLISFLGSAET